MMKRNLIVVLSGVAILLSGCSGSDDVDPLDNQEENKAEENNETPIAPFPPGQLEYGQTFVDATSEEYGLEMVVGSGAEEISESENYRLLLEKP